MISTSLRRTLVISFGALIALAPPMRDQIVARMAAGAQQPQEVSVTLKYGEGQKSHIAVPDFLAPSGDAATQAAARTMADVLWHDLNFEAEFDMIPRDQSAKLPPASSVENIPFDLWKELGADAIIFGTVQKVSDGLHVEVRIITIADRHSPFNERFDKSTDARRYAHKISDDIHKQFCALDGVAQTRIAFSSTRDGERVGGTIQERSVKHIYISDYDGANPNRITVTGPLNIAPSLSPDNQFIAYTSYSSGYPDIVVQSLHTVSQPTHPAHGGTPTVKPQLPAWSPDGTKIAYCQPRDKDGRYDLWIVDRDGRNAHPITHADNIDESPAWNSKGTQIAYASDIGGGTLQIFVIAPDGTGKKRLTYSGQTHCDRPTWSPDDTKLVFACQTSSSGNDITIYDFATQTPRRLTNGEGNNESPNFAPNGRHIVFTTTRWGKQQLGIIGLNGGPAIRLTMPGDNTFPNWGH